MLRIFNTSSRSILMTTLQGRYRISTATQRSCKATQLETQGVEPHIYLLTYASPPTWLIYRRYFLHNTEFKLFYLYQVLLLFLKVIFRMNSLADYDRAWSTILDIHHGSDKDEGSGGPQVKSTDRLNFLLKLYRENQLKARLTQKTGPETSYNWSKQSKLKF